MDFPLSLVPRRLLPGAVYDDYYVLRTVLLLLHFSGALKRPLRQETFRQFRILAGRRPWLQVRLVTALGVGANLGLRDGKFNEPESL